MQVKITRTTVAAKQFVHAGQVYDLPEAEARALILLGKAEPVEAVPAAPEVMDTEVAAPVVATDEPKKRGRRAK